MCYNFLGVLLYHSWYHEPVIRFRRLALDPACPEPQCDRNNIENRQSDSRRGDMSRVHEIVFPLPRHRGRSWQQLVTNERLGEMVKSPAFVKQYLV